MNGLARVMLDCSSAMLLLTDQVDSVNDPTRIFRLKAGEATVSQRDAVQMRRDVTLATAAAVARPAAPRRALAHHA
jgi:hypothetical protein